MVQVNIKPILIISLLSIIIAINVYINIIKDIMPNKFTTTFSYDNYYLLLMINHGKPLSTVLIQVKTFVTLDNINVTSIQIVITN